MNDPYILNVIKGYDISLLDEPWQFKLPVPIQFNCEETLSITKEIQIMLNKNIICEISPQAGQYYSNIFIRLKKDGSNRIILNLRKLNDNIEKLHFKMESLQSVLYLMKRNCWFASVDLKDAYYSVSVSQESRKYLCFLWDNHYYKFTWTYFSSTNVYKIIKDSVVTS